MAVVQVDYEGDPETLQQELDEADLSAEVKLEGDGAGGAADRGTGDAESGGGIGLGKPSLAALIIAIVSILGPIKELLEGLVNFMLVNLAPVFSALRPLLDKLSDVLVGVGQFLSDPPNLSDITDGIMRALKQVANGVVEAIDTGLGPIANFDTPFPGAEGGSRGRNRNRSPNTGQRNEPENNQPGFRIPFPNPAGTIQSFYVPDLTDEANKDRRSNQQGSQNRDNFGGDSGRFDLTP